MYRILKIGLGQSIFEARDKVTLNDFTKKRYNIPINGYKCIRVGSKNFHAGVE